MVSFLLLYPFCSVCDAASLFSEFFTYFTDDILHKIQRLLQLPSYTVPEHLKNHVLVELDNLFSKNGASMTDYGVPKPDLNLCNTVKNRLLAEGLIYDPVNLLHIHDRLVNRLSFEQNHIYDAVTQAVYERIGQWFFYLFMAMVELGKTILLNAVI